MPEELYEEVFEYILDNTSFCEKEIPNFDLKVAGFVSHDQGRVLKIQRDELGKVSLEYGKGFQDCETESGYNYMRVVEAIDVRQINSLEEASNFLEPC